MGILPFGRWQFGALIFPAMVLNMQSSMYDTQKLRCSRRLAVSGVSVESWLQQQEFGPLRAWEMIFTPAL